MKTLKFAGNMLLGSLNPLNSMEFIYIGYIYAASQGLVGAGINTVLALWESRVNIFGLFEFFWNLKNMQHGWFWGGRVAFYYQGWPA